MEEGRRTPPSPRTKRSAAMRKLQKMKWVQLISFCASISSNCLYFFSQEQLMEALKKKKECNGKAQAVVEKLLDPFDDQNELIGMVLLNNCLNL
jgi:hypothetical protein